MLNSEYINQQSNYLLSFGISNAKNEINWYIEEKLKLSKNDYLKFKIQFLTIETKNLIDNFISLRKKNIPYQYIMKKVDFFGKEFHIDNRALIPRVETETIIRYLLSKNKYNNVLEVGVGSGVISSMISLLSIGKKILATDISKPAIQLAKKNINYHNIKNISLLQHNILQETFHEKFDLIISNPPYISLSDFSNLDISIKKFEPRQALTDESDGLIFYKRFSEIIKNILTSSGVFYCEIGLPSSLQDIESIFSLNYSIKKIYDLNNDPRFLEIKCL
tara:strand:+ start:1721 stop:2551 length:831 start_codon:yes stop_codon:yes gene_type:complete